MRFALGCALAGAALLISGCGGSGGSSISNDQVGPTVSTASPTIGSTGVSLTAPVTVTFSEAMTASSINSSTFTLSSSGGAVAGTVTYSSSTNTATFTPSANLANSTKYTATITTGAQSASGAALAAAYSWSFTTGAPAAPTVTSDSPPNAYTGITVNTTVTVNFSKAMTASTLTTSTFTLSSNSGGPVTGTVTCNSPCTTATFTPSAPLGYSTMYFAVLAPGITSTDGGVLESQGWDFTTAPAGTVPPTVTAQTPASGATNVSVSSSVTATFDQAMNGTTLTPMTFKVVPSGSGDSVLGSVSYNAGTNTATFTPSQNLSNSTLYTAIITLGAQSASGAAMAAEYTWSFTTPGYPTTVDFGTTFQTIDGFGGSTAWLGTLTTQQATALFSQSSGLGLSILRMRIDPSGSATGGGTYGMPYETSGWDQELANGKEAVAANPNAIVFATPWTPPPAWKLNGSSTFTDSGSSTQYNESFDSGCSPEALCGGYLDPNHYADYANYLEDFVNYFNAHAGFNLYAISMQNEPDWNPTSDPYESCIWSPDQMDAFVASLTAGGATDPITTKLIMPESLKFNPAQAQATLTDPNAVNNVSIVGGHLYGVVPSQYPFPAGVTKPVWMTEHATCESNCPASSVNDALASAEEVFNSMTVGQYSAYVWWWIWNDPADSINYGLINSDTTNPAPTYYGYGIGQYSKFIQPGYVRASATANPTSGVYVSAYTGQESGTTHYVIVAINAGTAATNLSFTLDNASAVTSLTPWQTTSGGGLVQQTAVPVTGGQVSYTLPAESITTLVQ